MKTTVTSARPLVWLITGTSQGFGFELARVALDRGDIVIATSRSPEKVATAFPDAGSRLIPVALDLADESQIQATVSTAVAQASGLDILVNNAGHGLVGAIEEISDREAQSLFEINVFGLLRVTRAALPYLRLSGRGRIANISSLLGVLSRPGWGLYSATKFALEGISAALAGEVAPFGIGVTIVEPGPFRTSFLDESLARSDRRMPEYEGTAGSTRDYAASHNGVQEGDPVRGAKAIVQAMLQDQPPLRLALGKIALDGAVAKAASMQAEYAQWSEMSLSADFPTAAKQCGSHS